MSLPYDLKKILGDVEPDAYAQLNSTFGSSIGETHLVVIAGQLKVFTRESLIGEFEPIELDPQHAPKLEEGNFADTLQLALKDGKVYDFSVSSFERDNVQGVVDAATGQRDQPVKADVPADPPEEIAEDVGSPRAPTPPVIQDEVKLDDLEEVSTPATTVTPVRKGKPATEKELPDVKGTEVKKEDGSVLYRSNDPGCVGCIFQLILFAGGVAGFWFLHIFAMNNASTYFGWGELDPEGGAWVGTKIVALICGVYVGGKSAGVISKIARAQLWGGGVLFKDELMVVFGPKSNWHKRFYLSNDLSWECRWYSSTNDDKDEKRSYNIFVAITQEDASATLKTTFSAKQVNLHVKNMNYTKLDELPKIEETINLDAKTFRKVITKVANYKGWKA